MKKTSTLLLLFIGINCFAQKQILALNLKLDSTYYMTTDANMTVTQDINGQQQIISTILNGRMSHKVTAVKDSIYEMEVRYESLGMHMALPGGQSINFSSDNKDKQDIPSKIMRSMLDKPFLVTINKAGKILAMKNVENLYSGMAALFPDASEEKKAQFKSQMEQSFGEKAFKGSFQDAFAVFPATKVGLNDKWMANTSLEMMVSVQIKTTYGLQQITDKTYLIHGDAAISSGAEGDFKQMNGMPMRFINMSGSATTELKLDKATCWITEAKIAKLVKGTVEIKDNPKVPGGMTFPMTISADMTVSGK